MILGEEDLLKDFDTLARINMKSAIGEGIAHVQTMAKNNCPIGPTSGENGKLRESITYSVQEKGDIITGTCYTDVEHGVYVEFGTGPKGQADHKDISPEIAVTYRQDPWLIHESDIDPATVEYYNFFCIETKVGKFYRSNGQAAHPFMYPALADNIEDVEAIIADELRRLL